MIYKFCAANAYSIENLQEQKLICQHYAAFNDPFEFWSRVVDGIPSPAEPERFQAAMATWGFSDVENAEDHQEYFESLEEAQPAFQLLFDHTRIACFGSDNSSLLMWSHYADGLRGFCIGFDEEALITNPKEDYLTDVEYLDTPPIVDSFLYAVAEDQFDYHLMAITERERNEAYCGPDSVPEDEYRQCADEAFDLMTTIWRRAFAVKPLEWRYEQERRLLIRTDGVDKTPVFRHYPASAMREIILGERMGPDYRRRLLAVVRHRHREVPIRCAIRSRESFRLAIEPLESRGGSDGDG